jgi:hypothetical protein
MELAEQLVGMPGCAWISLVRSLGVAILTDDKTGRASILSGVVFSMPWWLDARRVFDDVGDGYFQCRG